MNTRANAESSSSGRLRTLRPVYHQQNPRRIPSMQWMFRSNIPRHRRSLLGPDLQRRNFFGMGEVLSVLANPAETVRSLTESKRLLAEARQEIEVQRGRVQLRPRHTFSRLPGFFPRKAEMQNIERALVGEPSFTVLFGGSSVGKTALLREVLSQPQYHVLHFDLRIAGFADLSSLYTSLSTQMEQYFEEIAHKMEGYEEFEKAAWTFKHDRIDVQNRQADSNDPRGRIRTSDVARLMELFQSSLLKYWEFDPPEEQDHPGSRRQNSDVTSEATHVDPQHAQNGSKPRKPWFGKWKGKGRGKDRSKPVEEPKPREGHVKKMPVIFFDEAHKLPALIQSTDTMKCLLDSMLVLAKQDKLCHVIHATSDPFYQTWLRQLNVMQHCKILTIGDCTKAETRTFFRDHLIPRVPERLRGRLEFEGLYEAFGGKLAHWQDFITDFINSSGQMDVRSSSHFLQAHALLNLHIIHSSQAATGAPPDDAKSDSGQGHSRGPSADRGERGTAPSISAHTGASVRESLHPNLGPAGFRTYSPITNLQGPDPYMDVLANNERSVAMVAGYYSADFTAMQLLKVMSRLTKPDTPYLPYFMLCREIGVRAVDGMVKGRVLDLRWTEPVSKESGEEERMRGSMAGYSGVGVPPPPPPPPMNYNPAMAASASGTAVDQFGPPPAIDDEEVMIPVPDMGSRRDIHSGIPVEPYEEEYVELVGPKLVPITSIMRYAMGEVIEEYEDDQSVSEYASLADPDEY